MPSRPQALAATLFALAAPIAAGPAVAGAASPATVPGEVIVRFKPGAQPQTGIDARSSRPLPLPRTKVLDVGGGDGRVADAIAALKADPAVAYAEPNYIRSRRAIPNDPRFGSLWGATSIGAPRAWDITTGARSVTIAVADDGVDLSHPDLAANIWSNPGESGSGRATNGVDDDRNGYVDDWRGWDFADRDNVPRPEPEGGELAYHGTHVAGVLGAVGNNRIGATGVNWAVSIMPLRIFDRRGTTTTAQIVKAFNYAGRKGARALNASWGGSGNSRAERDAIGRWKRTLFVAAAPNRGINLDVKNDYPCDYGKPNIICVTASGKLGQIVGWAGYGKRTVDIAAPGVGILSTVPGGYEPVSGTSMATPQVAGTVGLVAAAKPGLSAAQIKDVVLRSATSGGLLGKVFAGRLNAERALIRAVNTNPNPRSKRPRTKLTKWPSGRATSSRRPQFRFRSNLRKARFQCRVDSGRWRRCSSPHRTSRLRRDSFHTFRVRATIPGGKRDRTPAKKRFFVRG